MNFNIRAIAAAGEWVFVYAGLVAGKYAQQSWLAAVVAMAAVFVMIAGGGLLAVDALITVVRRRPFSSRVVACVLADVGGLLPGLILAWWLTS